MAKENPKKEVTFQELSIDPEFQEAFKKVTDLIRLREIYVCQEPVSNECFMLEDWTSSCTCPNKKTIQINTKFGITDRALGKTKNNLYNPAQAKRRINNPLTDLIFDEFIPSRDMREQGKGYQINEVKRYSDIEKKEMYTFNNLACFFNGTDNTEIMVELN
ncbi:4902_t:CDS:2 [Racocetra fulgida]|uniref:4902_t:CDS:1 n=1 Tax=Racocetra fulgida TaxID=60492 RepID=A0A9N8ZBH6_9GLOM|nr:4902_t:CDS:2 [Racocetra fulgida]